ncbi:MAG TPA: copper amine oxidase [Actinomycetota bacterium]|nr:copper amine oxidase [Actinomycetota bacterium]
MHKRWMKPVVALAVVAVLASACGSEGGEEASGDTKASVTAATGLRTTLFKLLGEHVNLAAAAAGRALAGNTPAFEAAAAALDGNSNDIAAAIGSVYGNETQQAFDPLWRKHIGFVVGYVQGKGANDQSKQDKAVADLTAYAGEFGAVIESVTENRLTKDAVQGLVSEHVGTLKTVIDDFAAKDFGKGYQDLRTAYTHMSMIGDALAGAIADQKPDAVEQGDPATPVGDLQVTLFRLFAEHVSLAAAATGQALAGNTPAFEGAAKALEGNSNDIAGAVGSVYGDETQQAFDPLWKKHIGFFVDYTTGKAANDQAKQDKAVADLTAYANEFGAVIESVTEKRLTKAAVSELVTAHILGLKDVVDGFAAEDFAKAYPALRTAYGHMQMIGDALAGAIVDQFPDKY